jgi:hypothetical protein
VVLAGVDVGVSSVNVTYAINALPQAVCRFGLGKSVDGVPAPIMNLIARRSDRLPIQIYMKLTPAGRYIPPGVKGINEPPVGEFLLFEGETAWHGYTRNKTAVDYTITADHWLSDLSFASAISPAISPAVPSDLAFPMLAGVSSPDTTAGQQNAQGFSPVSSIAKLTQPGITTDLWKEGLFKLYGFLANTDHLADSNLGSPLGTFINQQFGTRTNRGNQQAVAALNRMNDAATPKLALVKKNAASVSSIVASNISRAITTTALNNLVSTSLWNHLLQCSGEYLFAISPGPTSAYPVPWLPNLRKPYKTILAHEYESLSASGTNIRTIRGTIIVGGQVGSAAGSLALNSENPQASQTLGFGSYKVGDTGQILIRQAPTWLAGVPLDAIGGLPRAAPGRMIPTPANPAAAVVGAAIVSTANPATALIGGAAAQAPLKPTIALEEVHKYLQEYAKGYYGLEVLSHRTGQLVGNLRFDLRPGSIVQVETNGPNVSTGAKELEDRLFGAIVSLTISVDVESGQSGTVMSLAHIRTEAENATGLTMTSHPLYQDSWVGGSLVL